MNSIQARHRARHIPEGMILAVALSGSLVFGMPIARVLRDHFIFVNKWIWFFVGLGAGFFVFAGFCFLVGIIGDWLGRKRRAIALGF